MVVLILLHALAILIGLKFGWLWAITCGMLVAACYCWMVLNPHCQWLGPVICKASNDQILITIDDGPDPHDTPILLGLLDQYHTKAIFFMIGEKAKAHPELVREVARRGHEIGNHTFTHPQASFWCAGPWRTRREISQCQKVIEEITGKAPCWFRAPVGHRNFLCILSPVHWV
ncbi:MAG: polysaccharide deacetylase family protein [Akkermansiaceae bacterium]|nr:polysaccharide deacetylase family protein [Akkermansiaceae bacterium]